MNPGLRRILFPLALLFWAGIVLWFFGAGRIHKYLAPDFRPIALAGGLGLAVLGLFNLLTRRAPAACGHVHEGGGHDHDASDLNPWLALAAMVLPMALAVAWTRDSYSLSALARKGLYDPPPAGGATFLSQALPPLTREALESSHRKTPDGYHEFSLLELFFATGDREMQNLLDGMKIETEGRWVTDPQDPSRRRLFRLFITCCAADSRAIPIMLTFAEAPPSYPEKQWVKAAGTIRYRLENGVLQPVLEVGRVLAADPPFEEDFPRF
jgi:uncharacterized repeat protein (TIGR03943 family)